MQGVEYAPLVAIAGTTVVVPYQFNQDDTPYSHFSCE